MKMKLCHIIFCSNFNEGHRHAITILFEMIDGSVAQWNNPSLEVVEMMLYHSKTTISYQPCNK